MMIRQAIVTRYHSPGNRIGSRVRATAEAGFVYAPWDHSAGIDDNHAMAAEKLATKFGWRGKWYGGALPGGGYAWVCSDIRDDEPEFETHGEG